MAAVLRVVGVVKLALAVWWLWRGLPTWVVVGYATVCGLCAGAVLVPALAWLRRPLPRGNPGEAILRMIAVVVLAAGVGLLMAWEPKAGGTAVCGVTVLFGPGLWAWARTLPGRWRYRRAEELSPEQVQALLSAARARPAVR